MSMLCNIGLFIVKVVVFYLFGLMLIIFSLVDSVIDLVFGIVLWFIICFIKGINYYDYFEGKIWLEFISIIVLVVIMVVVLV